MDDLPSPLEQLTHYRLDPLPVEQLGRVVSLTDAPAGFEGEGFPVRRAFAGVPLGLLDPFVHLDQMGEVEYRPFEPRGTDWHPHRGFETFTYLIDGEFRHQDTTGATGLIGPGGTQYMTAGAGVLHIETPPEHLVVSGGRFHGVQLWINLPARLKMTAPVYQDLQKEDAALLVSADGGAVLRLLAGDLAGRRGPGVPRTPLAVAHLSVLPGCSIDVPWPAAWNCLLYILAGEGVVAPDGAPLRAGRLVVLTGGAGVRVHGPDHTKGPALELLLLGGLPLREPVVKYGPFVMSTREEITAALEDFQAGRLGTVPADAIRPYRG